MPERISKPLGEYAAQILRPIPGSNHVTIGSGYAVSPGRILTALHCVIGDGAVPSGLPVKVRVRLVGDGLLELPKDRWSSPEATLIWPPPGTRVSELDLAILEVAPADCSDLLRNAPRTVIYACKETLGCWGSGFALWQQDRDASGQVIASRNHPITGKLTPVQQVNAMPAPFNVDSACPPEAEPWIGAQAKEPWGGQSGTVLFSEEYNVAVAVVARVQPSRERGLLRATTFSSVARDPDFLEKAGLEKAILNDKMLRYRADTEKSVLYFLHLLDRSEQMGGFERKLASFAPPERCPVVLLPIVGRGRDVPENVVTRLEFELCRRFPNRQAAYRCIRFVPNPGGKQSAEAGAQAVLEEIGKALQVPFAGAGFPADALAKALAQGNLPRAFHTNIAKADEFERAVEALAIVMRHLAAAGPCETPVLLLICVPAQNADGARSSDPLAAALIERLKSLVAQHAGAIECAELPPLGYCNRDDLAGWGELIVEDGWCSPPVNFVDLMEMTLTDNDFLRKQQHACSLDGFSFECARNAILTIRA